MKMILPFVIISLVFCNCKNEANINKVQPGAVQEKKSDTAAASTFTIIGVQDTVTADGDHIERYKNGVIRIRGTMKDGKREGLWKSWYDDGKPWSETTFKAGIRDGHTITWYPNGNKRYDGAYTNDEESGTWIYWDETGKEVSKKDYSKK
jgi:antitoxin component YwqK of YwqJK toxin-antitoxin module